MERNESILRALAHEVWTADTLTAMGLPNAGLQYWANEGFISLSEHRPDGFWVVVPFDYKTDLPEDENGCVKAKELAETFDLLVQGMVAEAIGVGEPKAGRVGGCVKKYLVRPSKVVSKNDGQVHHISAAQLIRLHGVNPRECIIIQEGEDWPRGYGPLETEAQRTAAGFKLLTPAYHGNYGELEDKPAEIAA